MAFGLPAYHEDSIRIRGASRQQLAHAAQEALEELGWKPQRDGKWRFTASVPMRWQIIFLFWPARFTVEAEEERLHLRSEGSFPLEWMDLGQHNDNIKTSLNRFDDWLEREIASD